MIFAFNIYRKRTMKNFGIKAAVAGVLGIFLNLLFWGAIIYFIFWCYAKFVK